MIKVVCIKNCFITNTMIMSRKVSLFLIFKDTIWYFSALDYMILSSLDGEIIGVFDGIFENNFISLVDFRDNRINEILE